jgi:H+-translocating NAD(P) transhydrogenase subunit beta
MTVPMYVQGAWFVGALLFIVGLKGMSSPAGGSSSPATAC